MRVDFAVDGTTAIAIYREQTGRQSGAVGDAVSSFVDNLRAGISASPAAGVVAVPVDSGQRFVGYLVEVGVRIAMTILMWLVIGLPLGVATLGFGLLLMPIIGSAILFGYYWVMYATRSGGLGHMAIGAVVVNYGSGEPLSVGRAAGRAGAVPWVLGSFLFPR